MGFAVRLQVNVFKATRYFNGEEKEGGIMLSKIILKTGKPSSSSNLTIPIDGITIFVGPNNSGKSLLLREIESIFISDVDISALKLVSDIEIKWIDENEIDAFINPLKNQHIDPLSVPADHIQIGRMNPHGGYEAANIHLQTLKNQAREKTNWRWFARNLLRFSLLRPVRARGTGG